MPRRLVVRITHGEDDPERAVQGLTVAAAAVASGVGTELWLMNEGVVLATPGVVERLSVAHAPAAAELWHQIASAAQVYACSPCMKRRSIEESALRDGVLPGGAGTLVASVTEDDVAELSF